MRTAAIQRETKETQISIELALDGKGKAEISTGIGFFDHMLTALSVHSGISMKIKVTGDLYVDCHHTIEDTGIALNQALSAMVQPISLWMSHLQWQALILATDPFLYSIVSSPIRAAESMISA